MFSEIWNACKSLYNRVKETIKTWNKPANITLAVGAITDLSRSKTDLLVENAMLRQQLIILKRSVKRPQFTNGDRTRLTLLARFTNFWQSALHIVQPDTILRWHRDMFKRYMHHCIIASPDHISMVLQKSLPILAEEFADFLYMFLDSSSDYSNVEF